MVELRVLRYFVTVADTGNIGRAATRLYLAQPSLSQQIRQLERQIGVELFVRERTGVRLTVAGERLADAARKVLAKADRFDRTVEAVRAGVEGTLSVGLAMFIPDGRFAAAMTAFRRIQPDAVVSTRNLQTPEQLAGLANGDIDVGFVRLPADRPDIDTVTISDQELGLLLPESDELAAMDAVPADRLSGRTLVTIARAWNPQFVTELLAQLTAAGAEPAGIRESDSITTTVDMALSGLGIPVISRLWTRDTPGLVWRPFAGIAPRQRWAVAWNRRRDLPLVKDFVDAIRAADLEVYAAAMPT